MKRSSPLSKRRTMRISSLDGNAPEGLIESMPPILPQTPGMWQPIFCNRKFMGCMNILLCNSRKTMVVVDHSVHVERYRSNRSPRKSPRYHALSFNEQLSAAIQNVVLQNRCSFKLWVSLKVLAFMQFDERCRSVKQDGNYCDYDHDLVYTSTSIPPSQNSYRAAV